MLPWKTILWFPIVLALALSMCIEQIAHASIQSRALVGFGESQPANGDKKNAFSSQDSTSSEDVEDYHGNSDWNFQ